MRLKESPAVRERLINRHILTVLDTAYLRVPLTDVDSSYHAFLRTCGSDELDYQQWLREALRNSGLALALPGGLDLLPDYVDSSDGWKRALKRLMLPRNYAQLVAHVESNLHWYMTRRRVAEDRQSRLRLRVGSAILAALSLACIAIGFSTGHMWLLGVFLLSVAVLPLALPREVTSVHRSLRIIRAAEFYLYLRESYRLG